MKRRIAGVILLCSMILLSVSGYFLADMLMQERKDDVLQEQLKEIYEMRDNPNLICYWYTKNEYTGKWIYQGTCIGYGIPYGAAITAPESSQEARGGGSYWNIVPLAEPNGLYTESVVTTATWILTTNDSGEIAPTYVESEISVSQTKMDARLCENWSIPDNY